MSYIWLIEGLTIFNRRLIRCGRVLQGSMGQKGFVGFYSNRVCSGFNDVYNGVRVAPSRCFRATSMLRGWAVQMHIE